MVVKVLIQAPLAVVATVLWSSLAIVVGPLDRAGRWCVYRGRQCR